MQGSWAVTALESDGEAVSPAMFADARIVIEGNRFTSLGMGGDYAGTLVCNASSRPAQLDMTFDRGHAKGTTNVGIYRLERDTWTFCLATQGTVRPRSFASKPGTGVVVETLVRGVPPQVKPRATGQSVKKSARSKPPGGPVSEFEGEWRMLSGVMNGKAMDESMVKWVRRVTEGNQTTVMAGPQTMLKVEFSCDASQSPMTIDYVNLAGSHKGKTQHGIYKFEGDVLTVCVAPPGAPRPVQWESLFGDNRTLTAWRRA